MSEINFSMFITAVGIAFILEGLPYFLFAERMPKMLQMLLENSPSSLRKIGIGALVLGLVLVYFGRSL